MVLALWLSSVGFRVVLSRWR